MAGSKGTEMVLTIAARIGGKAVNLIVFLVLARTLSVDELGTYGFIFTTVLVLSAAFDLGVRNSVAYFVGRRPELVPTLTLQTLVLWSGLAVVAMLALLLVLRFPGSLVEPTRYALPSCVLLASMLLIRMGQGVLLGQGRIGFYNQTELASRITLAIGVGTLLAMGRLTLPGAVWALTAAHVIGAGVLSLGLVPVVRGGRLLDISATAMLLRRGVIFMMAALLMMAANRVAFLLLAQIGNADEIGLFYGLQRLTEVITEVALAVSLVGFSQSVRARSTESAIDDAAQSTRISVAVFGAMALLAFILGEWLVTLALGPSFVASGAVFRVTLLGTLAASIWMLLFPSLSAIASPGLCVRIFVPNVVFSLLMCWGAYGSYGILGLATAFTATNVVLSFSFLLAFKRKYSVPIRSFLLPRRAELLEPLKVVGKIIQRRASREDPGQATS